MTLTVPLDVHRSSAGGEARGVKWGKLANESNLAASLVFN